MASVSRDVTAGRAAEGTVEDEEEQLVPGAQTGAGEGEEDAPSDEAAAGPRGAEEDAPERDALAEAEAKLARLEDRFLRARADYENLLKRTEREREDARRAAAARVIERVLGPVEVLDRALLDLAGAGDDARVRGLHLAVEGLKEALAREGLEAVPGIGSTFDHTVHEAVAREPADAPAGTVTEVIRTGYRLDGRLLRPALVKVSAGADSVADEE